MTESFTLLHRAAEHQRKGEFAEAEQLYREVLKHDPANADAYHLLGLMADSLGHPDVAVGMIGQAIRFNGQVPSYHFNLANILRKQDKLDESITLYRQALALDPEFAPALCNLGIAYMNQGQVSRARSHLERAIALKPDDADPNYMLGFVQMLEGNWAVGWRNMEWRWQLPGRPRHEIPGPQWDGGDLTGKRILLHSEQGLGDNIQFVRFVPMVKAKGGHVLFACPPQMAQLFRDIPGVDELLVGTFPKTTPYDCHAPLMSLPGLLNITEETLPAKVPYLHPPAEAVARWTEKFASLSGLKIGVVWRGNPTQANDRNRSAKPQQIAAAFDRPGISLISLQKDATGDELLQLGAGKPVYNTGPELTDMADTAAAMAALDLVISVDTSVCHLAGATAARVWTMLCFAPDWRWMLKRTDCPWYPTMRLFRQPRPGDWAAVAQDVKEALAGLAAP